MGVPLRRQRAEIQRGGNEMMTAGGEGSESALGFEDEYNLAPEIHMRQHAKTCYKNGLNFIE
jgi:hypothetical protein